MNDRAIESTTVGVWVAGANALAWLQGVNWGATAMGLTTLCGVVMGMRVKNLRDTGLARADVAKEMAAAALKQAEADQARIATDRLKAEADIELDKKRQEAMAGTIAGKLAEAIAELKTTQHLMGLKDKELQANEMFVKKLEERLAEIQEEQAQKRHDLRDDMHGKFLNLKADVMEKEKELIELRAELGKVKGDVKTNAKAIHITAERAGAEPVETAQISDSSGDFATLPEGGI